MDTNVAGLNRVYCSATVGDRGKAVTITDGINTWTGAIPDSGDLGCVFMIPSIPAPAKRRYTVTLHNGDASATAKYTRTIDLGFGDSVRIGLYSDDEPVKKGSIPLATNSLTGGVRVNDTTSNGIYLDGNNITLRTATGSQKGGVKVPTGYGLYMDDMNLKAYTASANTLGVCKVGTGLEMNSGAMGLKTASASQIGGVMVGTGLEMSSGAARIKEFARASVNITHDVSQSISAHSGKQTSVTTTDSTFITRMKRGMVERVSMTNLGSTTFIYVRSVDFFSSSVVFYITIMNIGDSSISISPSSNTVRVDYVYIP